MVSVMVNANVCCVLLGRWAPGGGTEKMDRMKIIKRRLSMSLRSARPVDDSLSELAEQMALDEPSSSRDNGKMPKHVQRYTANACIAAIPHSLFMLYNYTCVHCICVILH